MLRQEDHEIKVSLGYLVRLCFVFKRKYDAVTTGRSYPSVTSHIKSMPTPFLTKWISKNQNRIVIHVIYSGCEKEIKSVTDHDW